MSRPIDANELIRKIDPIIEAENQIYRRESWGFAVKCRDAIEEMPTIEPQRKTGEWQVTDAYPHNVYCSECHKKFAQTHWAVWEDGSLPRNYCPNCGAKMRDENDEIPDDIPMEYFENGGV